MMVGFLDVGKMPISVSEFWILLVDGKKQEFGWNILESRLR